MSESKGNRPYISNLLSSLANNHPSSTVESKYQSESATKQEDNREDAIIASLVSYSTELKSQYDTSLQNACDRILTLENKVNDASTKIDKANTRISRSKKKVINHVWFAVFSVFAGVGSVYLVIDNKIIANSERIVSSENRTKDKIDEHVNSSSDILRSHAESISKLNSDVSTLDNRKDVYEKLVPEVASNSAGIKHISDRLNIKTLAVNSDTK